MHELRRWVTEELACWTGKVWKDTDLFGAADRELNIFIVMVVNGHVLLRPKSGFYDPSNSVDEKSHPLVRRAFLYQNFFQNIIKDFLLKEDFVFAIDVGDDCHDSKEFPVFSFQRRKGQSIVLVPDVDFLATNFYQDEARWSVPDPVAYDDKSVSAVFVGSTSGYPCITHQALADNVVPRIRAARFFKDKHNIEFYLPNIVQCENEDVVDSIRAEGFGDYAFTWRHQLNHKFLICIDGNGAACSRPYIALASNSVPLKYSSNHELYYFRGLEEGRHFLEIRDDQDVIEIVAVEASSPGSYYPIAGSGKVFTSQYLTRDSIAAYTCELLTAYDALQKTRRK